MSTATTTTHDPLAARKRLSELRAERGQLTSRLSDLQRRAAAGRTPADIAAAAERLIAGEPAAMVIEDDVANQARVITDQLAVIGKAEDTLERIVQLDELRTGSAAALPAFNKAVAHIARLDKALAAVAKMVRDAAADVDAFERMAPFGLADRFPDEPRLYDVQRLLPLRAGGYPTSDFIELYSVNATRYQRWREEAKSLGDL